MRVSWFLRLTSGACTTRRSRQQNTMHDHPQLQEITMFYHLYLKSSLRETGTAADSHSNYFLSHSMQSQEHIY